MNKASMSHAAPRWNSLKTRITLATLSIFLIGIWSLSLVSIQLLRSDVRRLVFEQQASAAGLVASQVNRELSERLEALQSVAELASGPMQAGPAAMQAFLDTRLELQSYFDSRVYVAQHDGLVIACWPLGNGPVGYNLIDRDYLAAALKEGKAGFGRPLISRTNGPVIVMAAPIRDAQGAIIGALAGSISLAAHDVFDQITENRFGRTGTYALVAPQHRLIITSTDEKRVFLSLPAAGINPVIDRFSSGAEGDAIAVGMDGEEVITSVKNVPVAGWQVSVSVLAEEAFEPIRSQQRRILIGTIVFSLLAGFAVWWMLRRQLKPLQTTASLLASLTDGGQPLGPLPVSRNDEIGQVIGGFNRLIHQLSERETTLRQVLDAASVAIFLADKDGRIKHANRRTAEMFRLPLEEVVGRPFTSLLPPADREAALRKWAPFLDSVVPEADFDRIFYREDRSEFWGHLSITPFYDTAGCGSGHISVIADISERKQAEQALQKSKQQYDKMAAQIPIGIFIHRISEAGVFSSDYVSPRTAELFGIEADVLAANPEVVFDLVHPDDHDHIVRIHLDAVKHRTPFEWQGRVVAGSSIRWLQIRSSPEVQENGDVLWHGLVEDVTEGKEYERQLEQIAHYDSLTWLPNRALLGDRLKQAMAQIRRRGKRLAVACLDLDEFRKINDQFGHNIGDQMLISMAGTMRRVIREGDTLARLGGDEFVAVLLDLDDEKAGIALVNRLLASVSQATQIGEYSLQVSSSIGVAFYCGSEDFDADQLLRQADQAMYQAKVSGKNRYHVFDSDQDRNQRGWHEVIEDIRRGLAAREFVLFYQPKVNMRTGVVVGAEALIRWQHREQGLLSPIAFLPAIESHPIAVEIGEWVIDSALRQMEDWSAIGLDMHVSVNIGALQLQQIRFHERLREILAAHPKVSPGRLTLEILESSALEDLRHVAQAIEVCQGLGVNFALDDFGTGYSSLTYLKRLSVNQLKIDQSFVRDMLDDPEDLAILEGVIGLAGAFRREVVAEGVETDAHGELLLLLGCELAQGYGIARPMPAADLPAWAASWRPSGLWKGVKPVSRENLTPIFATTEHRSWVLSIENYIKGLQPEVPRLSVHQCRLAGWLNREGKVRYGDTLALAAIERLHIEVHELAAELVELAQAGQKEIALEKLARLHSLRDGLAGQLKILVAGELT